MTVVFELLGRLSGAICCGLLRAVGTAIFELSERLFEAAVAAFFGAV